MFRRANKAYTRELKRILRFKGVYTGRINLPPSETLFKLLNEEDCPQWPDELLRRTKFDTRSAAYMLQQRMISGPHTGSSGQITDVRTVNRVPRNQTHALPRDQEFGQQEEQE